MFAGSITHLQLDNCGLQNSFINAFKSCETVVHLSIRYNHELTPAFFKDIKNIVESFPKTLRKIHTLDISGNKVQTIVIIRVII